VTGKLNKTLAVFTIVVAIGVALFMSRRTTDRGSERSTTATSAPVAPSALTPASATYSDFFLNVFMVFEDSSVSRFKVITLKSTTRE
jgi:hypothetical protein